MWQRMLTHLRTRVIMFVHAGMLDEAEAYAIAIERLTYAEVVKRGRPSGQC